MADWKRILNPWAALRQAELTNAALEQKCEDLWERCEEAEERAFRRASEHYYTRSRMVEEQLRVTQEQLVNISNLTPRSLSFIATTTGEGDLRYVRPVTEQ